MANNVAKEIELYEPIIVGFKQNKEFYNYLKLIKGNKDLYIERLFNPLNPKSSKMGFYSQQAIDALKDIYLKKQP